MANASNPSSPADGPRGALGLIETRGLVGAIEAAEQDDITCVEMEAAGLYAYATARGQAVVCFAHITNTMATTGTDFEKGADNGAHDALAVARAAAEALS